MNNLRRVVTTAFALMLSMASAAPALAVTVSRSDGLPMDPNGEPFSAVAPLTLQKGSLGTGCNVTFNGTVTSAGIVRITSITIPKKTGYCVFFSSTVSSVQPWTGQFDSATQLTINNATLSTLGLGTCGPNKLTLNWVSSANYDAPTITFLNTTLDPDCKMTGTAVVAPDLIVQ